MSDHVIYCTFRYGKMMLSPTQVWRLMDPHQVFLSFLDNTSHDHTVLLDLLASPETCFLLYFIKYLHYAVNKWSELCQACTQHIVHKQVLPDDVTMTCSDEAGEQRESQTNLVCQLTAEVEHVNTMNADLKQQLIQLLRNVSSDRLRVTQMDLVKEVGISLHELKSKNQNMQQVVETAQNMLASDRREKDVIDGILQPNADTVSTLTTIDNVASVPMDTNQRLPNLTEYSDSEDEDESNVECGIEETIWTEMVQDCSKYLDNVTERAALMSLIGSQDTAHPKLPKLDSELIDYPDSDSDGEDNEIEEEKSKGDEITDLNAEESDLKSDSSVAATCNTNKSQKPDSEIFKIPLPPSPQRKSPQKSSVSAVMVCEKGRQSVLDDMMSVLIRLRLAIEKLADKGLFPYNAVPLIRILTQCESLYEQQ